MEGAMKRIVKSWSCDCRIDRRTADTVSYCDACVDKVIADRARMRAGRKARRRAQRAQVAAVAAPRAA
jgi:hypothetical protein